MHPDISRLQHRTKQYQGEIHGQLIVHDLAYTADTGNRYWRVWCCNCRSFKNVLSASLNRGIEMCYDCKPNRRNKKI